MKNILCVFIGLYCIWLIGCVAWADQSIKVGVVGEAPFVTDVHQREDGVAIALWQATAEQAHLNYEFVPLGTDVDKALAILAQGKVQALVGPIAVTAPRLDYAIFSRPFYLNTLAVVSHEKRDNFFQIIKSVVAPFIQSVFAVFVILLLIFAALHWYYESKKKSVNLSLQGFFDSLWNVGTGLLTAGYPIAPNSAGGKIISIFCIICGLSFSIIFSAAITTAMTITSSNLTLADTDLKPKALFGRSIALINGSYTNYLLEVFKVNPIEVSNFREGIELVANNKADGYIDDYATIKYNWKDRYKSQGLAFSKFPLGAGTIEMAFAFPKHSPLRDVVDKALTTIQDHNNSYKICTDYLGAEDAQACII